LSVIRCVYLKKKKKKDCACVMWSMMHAGIILRFMPNAKIIGNEG